MIAGGEPARIGSSAVGKPAKSARDGGTRAASGLLRSTADGGGCSTCAAVCRGADDGGGADGGLVGGHWYDIGAERSPMVLTPAELGRGAKDCGVRRGLRELQHDETCTDGMKTESPMGETRRVRRVALRPRRDRRLHGQLQKVDFHFRFMSLATGVSDLC